MSPEHREKLNPGIGATEEFSLRVSVAALARVLFQDPKDGAWLLALERRAALREAKDGRVVEIKSRPFGGAIRIRDEMSLRELIGDFHFDSERSRFEQDFRIFIRPSKWDVVREFCVRQFGLANDAVLETDPGRELVEEFAGALHISLTADQYSQRPIAIVVDNNPTPTENVRAEGYLTARVYRVFEVRISDASLAHAIMTNSESISDSTLRELALKRAQSGGKGRANAILALPLKRISDFYLGMSPEERRLTVTFEGNRLTDSVAAVLEGIAAPKSP